MPAYPCDPNPTRPSASGIAMVLLMGIVACADHPSTAPTEVPGLAKGAGGGGGPTVKATDPSSGERNTTLNVRVLGSGFDLGSRAIWALDGDTAFATTRIKTNSTTFVSSTELVANITIGADANVALHDVVVVLAGGGKKGIGIELFEVVYEQIDLGISAWPEAINEKGQIVGRGGTPSGAFLWDNGVVYDLGVLPGMTSSVAEGINENGQVVGYSMGKGSDGAWISRGWLWTAAEGMRELNGLGGARAVARGINDNGDIVGSSASHAVMWRNGAIIDLHTLPGGSSEPWDINNDGVVVGTYWGGPGRSFRWTAAGGMELLFPPGLYYADEALGINDNGQIVGWLTVGDPTNNEYYAYLWEAGEWQILGGEMSVAIGINDAGQAVGRTRFRMTTRRRILTATVAYVWTASEGMKNLDGTRQPDYSEAYDINANGWVVGIWRSQQGEDRATLWKAK